MSPAADACHCETQTMKRIPRWDSEEGEQGSGEGSPVCPPSYSPQAECPLSHRLEGKVRRCACVTGALKQYHFCVLYFTDDQQNPRVRQQHHTARGPPTSSALPWRPPKPTSILRPFSQQGSLHLCFSSMSMAGLALSEKKWKH